MQTVNQLFRLLNEMVFILVGALLLWVAFAGRYLFDPRRPSWLVVSVILILWGVRSWRQARAATAGRWRVAGRISGGSLALVGPVDAVTRMGAISLDRTAAGGSGRFIRGSWPGDGGPYGRAVVEAATAGRAGTANVGGGERS